MKKIAAILASFALLATSTALADTVKIGFVTTLTGGAGAMGNDMRDAAELALDHLDRKMGGLDVQMIYEDDGFKPEVGKQKTEKLIGSVDTVLILISGFLNSETQENFMETFNSIRRSFQMLENTVRTVDETVVESQHDLQTVIRNLASITSNLAENNDELNRAFNNIGNITDSLAQVKFAETFQSLNKALVSAEVIMNKVAEGDGTLGMLINDKELYNNLQEASNQLEILLEDVRYNPKRYVNFSVFGKSESYSREEIIEMEKERKAREDTSRKENSDNSD